MEHNYETLVEAIQGLRKKGYDQDFNLQKDCLHCASLDLRLHPEDFAVKEVYRFEGMSNPDDNSVVYAIESKSGTRGILVDAYGAYAEALTPELAKKLSDAR